jgi:uncharacterized repeat protein (TIGR03803 family)
VRLKLSSFALLNLLIAATVALLLAPVVWAKPKFEILYAFKCCSQGAGLWSSLIFDKAGNLYGTSSGGGAYGDGTVYELTPKSNGKWSEKVLHSFDFYDDGESPLGAVTFDPAGNLYGTTYDGGAYGGGTAFELTPNSDGNWTETTLYNFCSQGPYCNDGAEAASGVVIDSTGNLYGPALVGGSDGGGVVFDLTMNSTGWTESVLYNFGSQEGDGSLPYAGLIWDAAGNLYGTTENGGTYSAGTVYEMKHSADGWKEHTIYEFKGGKNDGAGPRVGALVFDKSGNLYGTTTGGGTHECFGTGGCGTVYRLTRDPHGYWKDSILYDFVGGRFGDNPGAGVAVDAAGNLYGGTLYGGSGCGLLYELKRHPHGKWKYSIVHTFEGSDGCQPNANMVLDSKGNLYGTTIGGYGPAGVVYEVTP